MKTVFTRFIREEDGQNLVEYALLAGLVALVALASIKSVGGEINRVYGALVTKLGTITVP